MKKTQHVLEYSQPSIRGNVIKGVKIIGAKSAHGRNYPAAVLEKAIPLYESAPVFISHPDPREKRRGSRLLRDHLGNLENVGTNGSDGGLFGDLSVKLSHPLARQIMEEAPTASFGLSHNAIVEMNADETEVTSIVEVNSVDLVDDPATTKNLFEEITVPENTNQPSFEEKMLALMEKIEAHIDGKPPGKAVVENKNEARALKRLTALEDRGDDEGDPPKIGNTHDDFMGVLRGFSVK